MKKLFAIGVLAMLLSSCSTHKALVNTTRVHHPVIESTTMATVDVDKKRISYTYVPTRQDAKVLSETQLIQNAMYMALAANGNADVLVKVNSFVTYKKGLLGKRVKSISISGYPARYVDFREPNDDDLKSVWIFNESNRGNDSKDGEGKPSFFSRLFGGQLFGNK